MTSSNTHPFTITPVRTTADLTDTINLFEAYATSLGFDLSFQNFTAEMASMPGKYSPPDGELLLARDTATGQAIGCVGLRPLPPSPASTSPPAANSRFSEMKRLYVSPDGRGSGVGKALAGAILDVAEKLGYDQVRLDTLPSMVAALNMYRGFGFEEIPPYYDTPMVGTHFLGLKLPRTTAAGAESA